MPRAHRHFLPGYVWHITHRCHQSQFLLKYAIDRERYLYWLLEARKRFGLCVLNYMVTCNHVHLLVRDTGGNTIASSIRLAAGRTGQEYNRRKDRRGAFWEDRYHATAIDSDQHLLRCISYIDLNMVRAGETGDADGWPHSGFHEIQGLRERYAIIDLKALMSLCGFEDAADFRTAHRQWAVDALSRDELKRDDRWSGAVAVGGESFVTDIRKRLGLKAGRRSIAETEGTHILREDWTPYAANPVRQQAGDAKENSHYWRQV